MIIELEKKLLDDLTKRNHDQLIQANDLLKRKYDELLKENGALQNQFQNLQTEIDELKERRVKVFT